MGECFECECGSTAWSVSVPHEKIISLYCETCHKSYDIYRDGIVEPWCIRYKSKDGWRYIDHDGHCSLDVPEIMTLERAQKVVAGLAHYHPEIVRFPPTRE